MGNLNSQAIEHRSNVIACPLLRIGLLIAGNVGRRIAARVVSDAPVASSKIADLRLVAPIVAAKFVDEHDRESLAPVFVI